MRPPSGSSSSPTSGARSLPVCPYTYINNHIHTCVESKTHIRHTQQPHSPQSHPPYIYISALPPDEAGDVLRSIRHNLGQALQTLHRPWESVTVISRSDSTLRGHFPLDVDILCGGEGTGRVVTVVAPYFEAGGRLTVRLFAVFLVVVWDGLTSSFLVARHVYTYTHINT